jgi:hypothetical protein
MCMYVHVCVGIRSLSVSVCMQYFFSMLPVTLWHMYVCAGMCMYVNYCVCICMHLHVCHCACMCFISACIAGILDP